MDAREAIAANVRLVIEQLGPISEVEFGLNPESVEWVEGYVERQRARPDLTAESRQRMADVLGSFLGECIVAATGGSWHRSEQGGQWGVLLPGGGEAFPMAKMRKLFDSGLAGGDSIVSFYRIATDPTIMQKLQERVRDHDAP